MNTEQARFNMVEQQIRTWEVLDQDVLDLLYVVRREEFVPTEWKALAFSDLEIPLTAAAAQSETTAERLASPNPAQRPSAASSERMWQPKMEARVIQELMLRKADRVLEVGTGSGYLTALLAHRTQHVFSVEINPALAAGAKGRLAAHAIDNVTLETGDAAQGWAAHAPYDVIVLTASTPVLPQSRVPTQQGVRCVPQAPSPSQDNQPRVDLILRPGWKEPHRQVGLASTLS